MFVVMGASGHVGSAVADVLLLSGEQVTIVTHHASHADAWLERGAQVVEADVTDIASLRAAFKRGRRAFLLNPPADTKLDTDVIERRTAANILAALDGSGLEKVVAASTYGAQPGERIGDLSVLWAFEQGLQRQPIPVAINRAAYYMSNWDALLEPVRTSGDLPTMFPATFAMPMIAPADLGKAAAARLLSPLDDVVVRYVEGPARYTPADVAEAFSEALGRSVKVSETPRASWEEAYLKLGFGKLAAESYTRMTAVTVDSGFDLPEEPIRGSTALLTYIRELVARG